ncbi:O-antigen ligase family protein [Candidatus Peregrinibacteria bacterium]|nr:O-antigen ligase family protein [Candidatus Peregrinibacteria bacterium]
MFQKLDKILLWILRTGLVLILFSVLVKHTGFFFPYIVPRTTYLQLIAEFLGGAAAIFIVLYPSYRPKWTFLSSALAAFFLAGLISVIFSADPSKSMFGTMERSFGFFNILHYGILFFVATVALRTQRQWNIFLAISIAISVYGAINLLNPVLLAKQVPSTVAGNPTFLSAYLIFHICFAAFLFIQTKDKYLKILLGIIIAIQASAILASNVRGGFVGLSAAVLFLMLYSIWKHKQTRTLFGGILIIIILSYGFIFINRDNPAINANPILQRITNFSLEDETIEARFAMWKIALQGIKERPIAGWGRENYSLVFNLYFDPVFDAAKVAEAWEDRTHNVFLDELINGGAIELLAYLFLLTVIFVYVRKNPLFIALLIAYTVQNLFGVDTLNSYMPFFLFLGLLNAKDCYDRHEEIPVVFSYKKPELKIFASVFAAFLIMGGGMFFSAQSARGNAMIYQALKDMAGNNYSAFQKSYEKGREILKPFPYIEAEALTLFSSLIARQAADFSKIDSYPAYITQLTTDMDRAYARNNLEHRVALNFVGLLLNNAVLDKIYLDKADNILRELIIASPDRKIYTATASSSKQIRAYLEKSEVQNPNIK